MPEVKQKLTREQKRNYLKGAGGDCPFCGSWEIEAPNGVEVDGITAWQGVKCSACGGLWVDVYKLIGVEEGVKA